MSEAASERARSVVEHVVKSLAAQPEAVRVDAEPKSDEEVLLLVHADASDLGRIIGRRGRVIAAVRQVARAAASVDGVRATVDVVE